MSHTVTRLRASLAAATVLVVAGCGGSASRPDASPSAIRSSPSVVTSPSPSSSGVVFPGVADPGVGATPDATALAASPPVRLVIARIGVDSGLQALGRLKDGSLESPSAWGTAGWYADGVVPGEVGPAVIAGHVDSTSGPAVFFRLDRLRPGDHVLITRRDGVVLRFVVDGAWRFPKTHFPTETVYGPTPDAQLRLITCTGSFDAAARSYRDNLVVSAHLVSATPARSVTAR